MDNRKTDSYYLIIAKTWNTRGLLYIMKKTDADSQLVNVNTTPRVNTIYYGGWIEHTCTQTGFG